MTPDPERCRHWTDKKYAGQRYVYSRAQCKRTTTDPSGYCWQHKAEHPRTRIR